MDLFGDLCWGDFDGPLEGHRIQRAAAGHTGEVTEPLGDPLHRRAHILVVTIDNMMAEGHANAFRITGPLWGESTSDWWIPIPKGHQCGVLTDYHHSFQPRVSRHMHNFGPIIFSPVLFWNKFLIVLN